jgi:hypothetical protein
MNASTNSCKIKNIADFLLQIVEHYKQGNWHFDCIDKQHNKHKCLEEHLWNTLCFDFDQYILIGLQC